MKHLTGLAILLICVLVVAQVSTAQIKTSKHDLSSSGGQTIRSTNTDEVCVFCHTPHSNQATTLLWNRTASVAAYAVYSSPSMGGTVPQPGGASKNCLSCHDGTVAFNSLINSPGSGAGAAPTMTSNAMVGWDSLGVNLSNDHPVSFVYTTHQLTDIAGLRAATLVNSKPVVSFGGVTLPLSGTTAADATLECTSCHDPHLTTSGQFKRVANTASQMCFTCHSK